MEVREKMKAPRVLRGRLAATLLASAALLVPIPLASHDIPVNALVQVFVRPEGNVLRFLVRVPLGTMRDMNFPTRGPGFIVISEATDQLMRDAAILWIGDYVRMYENGVLLPAPRLIGTPRLRLPSDRSFGAYDTALESGMGGPLPPDTEMIWQQALMDAVFEFDIQSADSRFSLRSELAHLGISTTTVLRFSLPNGEERFYQFTGDPGLLELDPRLYQAALRFVNMGFMYILEGIDHLLFLLLLVVPFRRVVPVVTLAMAFTVGHSLTLGASTLGFAPAGLWFPPLIETLIAASIVLMGLENLVGADLRRRWLVAFGFGLVHGYGFSFTLSESLQYAGSHSLTSLFAFNLGVELAQIAILLVSVPALSFLFSRVVSERLGIIVISALVAHTAWHWMTERWANVRQFTFQLPPLDLIFLLGAIRWLIAILALGGLAWLLRGAFGRLEEWSEARARAGLTPEA
jgi:hypothetical protein